MVDFIQSNKITLNPMIFNFPKILRNKIKKLIIKSLQISLVKLTRPKKKASEIGVVIIRC